MRQKPQVPTINKDGQLIVGDVDQFSKTDLQEWIKAVLRGSDPFAGGVDDLPHGFLRRVYRELDGNIREVFEDAVIKHLADLAYRPESEWDGKLGDELLLLVAVIFADSHRSREPVRHLRYIADDDRFRSASDINIRRRALQTLVAIGHRTSVDFWIDHYRDGGSEYASVAFAGLSIISPSSALQFVSENLSDLAVVQALLQRFPWIVQEYGPSDVARFLALQDLPWRLPAVYDRNLRELATRLGVDILSTQKKPKIFKKWTKKDLRRLAKALDLPATNARSRRKVLRRELGLRLQDLATIHMPRLLVPTPDAEIVIGIMQRLFDIEAMLPLDLIDALCTHMSNVIKTMNDQDVVLVAQAVTIIKSSGRDPKRELEEFTEQTRAMKESTGPLNASESDLEQRLGSDPSLNSPKTAGVN